MQYVVTGLISNRSSPISLPQFSQYPKVFFSTRSRASSTFVRSLRSRSRIRKLLICSVSSEARSLGSPKTKDFAHILNKLGIVGKKITFFPVTSNKNVVLSARNLSNVTVIEAINASTYDLLDAEVLLFEKEGLKKLNDLLTVN